MPNPDTFQRWRELITDNQDRQVLKELHEVSTQSGVLYETILLHARTRDLQEKIIKGIIPPADEFKVRDSIREDLLDLVNALEEGKDQNPEEAQAWTNVSIANVVNNSTLRTESGNIHVGDKIINYYGEKIERILTEPPQRPPVFKGRQEALRELHRKLFAEKNEHLIMLVNGQGGVGKTSLASQYFFTYQKHYFHVAWVLKDGSIADALLQLATGLNLEFTTETNEQRLRHILQKVANFKAPCLLIIDNANERDDLVKHAHLLRKCANFHVLLTSRLDNFDGIERYRINALPEPIAKALFQQYYREFSDDEAALFPEIYRAVDGNTLILQLLAKNLKKNRRSYTLNDLWTDLKAKDIFALTRSRKVVTDYGQLKEGQVEEIVAAMFNLKDLTGEQHALLSVFAALPPERIPYAHLEVLVNFLEDLDETLDELQQLGWIEEDDSGEMVSYRCSPVVQAVVKRQVEQWRVVAPLLRDKIEDQIVTDGGFVTEGIDGVRPFVLYGEAIMPNLPEEKANLYFFQQLAYFYNSQGDLQTNMVWVGQMAALSRQLLATDPENADLKNWLAISYSKLGSTHSAMGNLEKALEYFEKRSRIGDELYAAYPNQVSFKNGLAISYSKLGSTHSSMGNLNKALEYFELDIALSKELYAAYPNQVSFKNGLAISYERLGSTHSSMGNLDKALEYFDIENKLFEELYAAYPNQVSFKNGLAISYSKLGETHSAMGNIDKALEYFEERSRLGEELYAAYPNQVSFKNGLAISYEKLGETHSAMGNLEKALEYFDIENKLFEELYAAYPNQVSFKNGLAISYSKLGETHSAMGNLEKALEYFEEYNRLEKELYTAYPNQVSFKNVLAISYAQLGETHSSMGNLKKALEYFKEYHRLRKELYAEYPNQVSFKNGLNISYEKLGNIFLKQNDLERAKDSYGKSHKFLQELYSAFPAQVSFKNGLAISYVKLGKVAQDPTLKREQYQKAEQLWAELREAFPAYVEFGKNLAWVRDRLAAL